MPVRFEFTMHRSKMGAVPAVAVMLVVGACTAAVSPTPTQSPSPTQSASPTTSEL